MPVLERIVVQDFRNIGLQELEFSPNVNCITGNNGEGKTNLLDAIYYLAMTKSSLSSSDRFNFRYGYDTFSIAGVCRMPAGITSRFSIQVNEGGEKKLRRDDKPYSRISEHIGALPVVMVSPSDTSLVSESGEERRKFMNAVLSQLDPEYLSAVQQYTRFLAQRNKLLKEQASDEFLLDTFDERMAPLAAKIHQTRARFVSDIMPVVQDYYEKVSGGCETVSIEYKSDLDEAPLQDILRACRQKDRILKYTTAGVQRDDLVFCMNGYPIRKCGSQGQQKSFLVSLKFAQYEIMKRTYGYAPMLLLDDMFDKLDISRVSNLLKMVSTDEFGQIFLTDTNKVRLSSIVDGLTSDCAYFMAEAGVFKTI